MVIYSNTIWLAIDQMFSVVVWRDLRSKPYKSKAIWASSSFSFENIFFFGLQTTQLQTMTRTKQTARKSSGGKASRLTLNTIHGRSSRRGINWSRGPREFRWRPGTHSRSSGNQKISEVDRTSDQETSFSTIGVRNCSKNQVWSTFSKYSRSGFTRSRGGLPREDVSTGKCVCDTWRSCNV